MTMQRFDPFREMRRRMNDPLWLSMFPGPVGQDEAEEAQPAGNWSIPMDVHRDEKELTVTASLPGIAADDVDVSISPDRVLSVRASRHTQVEKQEEGYLMRERRSGSFARAIRLPSDLNLDGADVDLTDGVLTVKVPVSEAAQTRRLQISSSSAADAA